MVADWCATVAVTERLGSVFWEIKAVQDSSFWYFFRVLFFCHCLGQISPYSVELGFKVLHSHAVRLLRFYV